MTTLDQKRRDAKIAARAVPKQFEPYAWKPGQSGNPAGRAKGTRNKLGEDFLHALCEDFATHGKEVIIKVREEKPDQYLKVVASLMPKEIDASDRMLDALGELLSRVDGRTRAIVPVIDVEPLLLVDERD